MTQTNSLINALRKKNVPILIRGNLHYSRNWSKQISFSNQDGTAICIRVRRISDKDFAQEDYISGNWHKSIKSAIKDFLED